MTSPERYHLTLSTVGRPVMHGWWVDLATAERKFQSWIGDYGGVAGARIVLVDETEHRVVASWPDEPDRLSD